MKMLKIGLIVIVALALVVFVALALVTRSQAIDTMTHPPGDRPAIEETPADYGMAFEEVTAVSCDGLKLHGWYVPGTNGATIMMVHGTPGGRQDGLYESAFLNRQGYNILMGSFRAHDESEGEIISFGYHEVKDLEAWHGYLRTRDDVDPERIGLFGESMGGATSILYAAEREEIRAVATSCAFALTQETVETFIQHELDPPPWVTPVLARFIVFWAEREGEFETDELDTEAVIGRISPRPLLIMQGQNDDKISPDSGRKLYAAAEEPKELWEPPAGHDDLELHVPDEYEQRVVAFFDGYLRP
jgi:fermentation-respiration switch protein FrsA (DUF1100 family)